MCINTSIKTVYLFLNYDIISFITVSYEIVKLRAEVKPHTEWDIGISKISTTHKTEDKKKTYERLGHVHRKIIREYCLLHEIESFSL
jgi:hypothetical protein